MAILSSVDGVVNIFWTARQVVCVVQGGIPEQGLGGDVQRSYRSSAQSPNLPEPHLLPAPEAYGG